ncbi:MAG: hypothetical protein Q7R30_19420 [Acidobacteriota bacterium]|nr:hypothetical protein [Acidobacteriota bacterium]
MDTVLLAVTVISLVVALVMSVSAWRVTRDDKRRSAARIAALSLAASEGARGQAVEAEPARAPWAPARLSVASTPRPAPAPQAGAPGAAPAPGWEEMFLNEPAPVREISHSTGFLSGTTPAATTGSGGRQHSLAIAAAVLFVGLASGLFWMMSGPRGTTAAAVGPNMPLELVSLRHDRQNAKLAVSGLVRNPVTGRPVERLSAVVFLFDQQGTFMTSATAPVDFIKLGVGDESPFVVALDAPANVARYRVSFRTGEGVVPHIDRRGAAPIATGAEQPVSVKLK